MDERPPWERPDEENQADPTEGVRIIGDEEAAEAIERGDVAPRRGDGTPRYGDRPSSPPDDVPRPALRFPLGQADPDEGDVARPRVVGSTPSLPPWTDPPTGEVPRLVPPDEGEEGEDLEAWSSFTDAGPRWRDRTSDWEDAEYESSSMLHDDESRVGALDESDRPAPDDFFGDAPGRREPVIRGAHGRPAPWEQAAAAGATVGPGPEAGPARAGRRHEPHRPVAGPGDGGPGERDVRLAVITGVGLAVAALILFSLGPGPAMVLVVGIVVVCAAELFASLQRGGYQPATLLGLVASGALVASAYWRGEAAIPLVLGLTLVFTLLWYLVGVSRIEPTMNVGVSLFGVAYTGLLGSFAALMLAFPNGRGLLAGTVVAVVANDVGALVAGQRLGERPIAPEISPNKTVEGAIGGAVAAVLVSIVVLGFIGLHPWDVGSALALGLVVAVMAPLGDLCESLVKRDLGIKDMGSILPGHGGLLDRFDALLFCLPAVYYLARLLEIF
ncbi:MAG TPA: phosphatidate cytidylyltransferase [Acidimicrobiales bacterium]|nr:phosphatidate cytidylyltransferase [Acidimicrobiales bacterium]